VNAEFVEKNITPKASYYEIQFLPGHEGIERKSIFHMDFRMYRWVASSLLRSSTWNNTTTERLERRILMHWLALILSDHPHQDPTRDFAEDAPRRAGALPGSWRSVAALEATARASLSSRCAAPVAKPAGAVLS
jgi:hypothetical protein